MTSNKVHPHEIDSLSIQLISFDETSVIDITDIVPHFNIYESVFDIYATCDLIVADANHLLSKLPIVGEEYVVFRYRTAGFTASKEEYELRVRSFKIYKLSERAEDNEATNRYKLHGIDDHFFVNEGHNINQSFVGQNCIAACESVFKSYFVDPIEFRPFDKTGAKQNLAPKNLVNNQREISNKKYETSKDFQSQNNSTLIAPGLTPIETITYLKNEALNKDQSDTSNYVLYQNVEGFQLRTLSQLKNGDVFYSYYLKDMGVNDVGEVEENRIDPTTMSLRNSILTYNFRKTFDTMNNLELGMYGNRVVAIDLLTKKYDERIFSYNTEWPNLSPIESGPNAAKLMSDAEQNMYSKIGSTQTRYIATELLSNMIPTGNPTQFSKNEHPSYKQTPYFYPIDKEDPDEMLDKLNGTLKNEDAKFRMVGFVRDDNKLKNPKLRHLKIDKEIGSLATLDNIVLDMTVPGNSDLMAGDIIHVFIPDSHQKEQRYLNNLGQVEPRMLVIDVRQSYLMSSGTYTTMITCVKDSLNISIEKISQIGKDSG
ncbi:MAG: hypothetical protein CL554_16700 [Algoriphagus sp.]|uniref:hypothetical protein n=1 Tax=Algoriphagus sp. TaxID=1872435 RepID=UPI000C51CF5C|nr:hypothetical protein [Algoriphagus sp.]MAL15053.1 hypothetical protein [Algoriphagus sp.]|tara:strand:- start:1297 stop:2919 length:1623 start_codon:yes stop_codon:yes gene_type:complete